MVTHGPGVSSGRLPRAFLACWGQRVSPTCFVGGELHLILPETEIIPGFFVYLFTTWIYPNTEIVSLVNLDSLFTQ